MLSEIDYSIVILASPVCILRVGLEEDQVR